MMICRVKLYIMADARPSPPPARPLLMEPTAWVAASMIIMMMIMMMNMVVGGDDDDHYDQDHDNYMMMIMTMITRNLIKCDKINSYKSILIFSLKGDWKN